MNSHVLGGPRGSTRTAHRLRLASLCTIRRRPGLGPLWGRHLGAQDAQVSEGDGVVRDDDRTQVYTMLPADLPDGRYIARWKTTSDEDGDTDEGAFCFYVGVEPTDEQAAEWAAFGEETEAPPTQSLTTPTSPPTVVPATETAAPPPPTAGTEPPSDEADGGGATGGAT